MPATTGVGYGQWTIRSRHGTSSVVKGAGAAHRRDKADCFRPTVKDQAASVIAETRSDWRTYRTLDDRLAQSVGTAKNGNQA